MPNGGKIATLSIGYADAGMIGDLVMERLCFDSGVRRPGNRHVCMETWVWFEHSEIEGQGRR